MDVGDKIKYLRKKHHMTQSDLAKQLNVAPTSVSAWEGNKNRPMMDKLSMIASIFDVPIGMFFQKDVSTFAQKAENIAVENISPIKIPVLGTISCMNPIYIEENFCDYVLESREKLPEGNLLYVHAIDDGMEPKIPKGSRVLIIQQSVLEHGTIVAVRYIEDSYILLKRVKKQGNLTILLSDNMAYDPIIYHENSGIEVIGKAIRVSIDL